MIVTFLNGPLFVKTVDVSEIQTCINGIEGKHADHLTITTTALLTQSDDTVESKLNFESLLTALITLVKDLSIIDSKRSHHRALKLKDMKAHICPIVKKI